MEITWIGWVAIVLAPALLLLMPERRLYGAMLFFVPFSATSIANIEGLKLSFLLWTFLGGLWILRHLVQVRLPLPRERGYAVTMVVVFAAIAGVSLLMPVYIDGQLLVGIGDAPFFSRGFLVSTAEYYPLRFSGWHVVNYLELLFGLVVAVLIGAANSDRERLRFSLRVMALSGGVVALLGLLEVTLPRLGLPYPFYFLNNSASGFIEEGRILQDIGVIRMSSVAEEPSILARHLLRIVPLVLFGVICRQPLFSSQIDAALVFLMAVALLLSTSATAIVGFGVMMVVASLVLLRMRRIGIRYAAFVVVAVLAAGAFYWLSDEAAEFVNLYVLSKLETGSGAGRVASVWVGLEYFWEYPLLGVGWGVVPVYDLVMHVLVHVGVLGFVAFAVMLSYVLGRVLRLVQRTSRHPVESVWAAAAFVSALTLLAAFQVSGFNYRLGDFWLMLGISLGLPGLATVPRPRRARLESPAPLPGRPDGWQPI